METNQIQEAEEVRDVVRRESLKVWSRDKIELDMMRPILDLARLLSKDAYRDIPTCSPYQETFAQLRQALSQYDIIMKQLDKRDGGIS